MKLKLLCGFALLVTGFVAGQFVHLPEKAELLMIESQHESADPVENTTIVGLTIPNEHHTPEAGQKLRLREVDEGSKIEIYVEEADDDVRKDATYDEIKVDCIFTPLILTNGGFVIGESK